MIGSCGFRKIQISFSQEFKMPNKTKKTQSRRSKKSSKINRFISNFSKIFVGSRQRISDFLSRRPHRSFRFTRRRDYARSLKLPGYFAFTFQVFRAIWSNKKAFLAIILIYSVVSIAVTGISSAESLAELRGNLSELGQEVVEGGFGSIAESGILAASILFGSLTPELNEAQQVYLAVAGLLIWLAIVWLLRQRLAGRPATLRDALYNSGAPIVPTAMVSIVLILQIIPIGIVAIGYAAASSTGLLDGGVEAMLFWLAAAGLACLSIYWITSTALALVVVTLPGMYPHRALSIAGDMVVGRRVRILLRLFWLALVVIFIWLVVMTVAILIDAGIKSLLPALSGIPIVSIVVIILGSLSLVVSATYVYLLYRRIVDDDAKPA